MATKKTFIVIDLRLLQVFSTYVIMALSDTLRRRVVYEYSVCSPLNKENSNVNGATPKISDDNNKMWLSIWKKLFVVNDKGYSGPLRFFLSTKAIVKKIDFN